MKKKLVKVLKKENSTLMKAMYDLNDELTTLMNK